MSKKDLQGLKDYSDKLCLEIGASVIPKKEKTQYIKRNEYRVAEKGKSWKFKLMNAIDLSLAESRNKEKFIKSMNKLGYQVNWTDTRKYITYTTPEGYKCRDNKLYSNKYLKTKMEQKLKENKQQSMELKQNNDINNKKGLIVNNLADDIINISNMFSSPQNNNSKRSIKRYRTLSKQAMKEYAIKKANASSFDWEEEM